MCGIAGYVGKKEAKNFLLESLVRLEYRGYDSAGCAFSGKGKDLIVIRKTGRVENLIGATEGVSGYGCGIAHTRWATHGAPEERNAHPQISEKGTWAVVHNGIIENYRSLKENELAGVKFSGETDTETIPNLLEKEMPSAEEEIDDERLIERFIRAISLLKGSYAILAARRGDDRILLAKNKSPLYAATADGDSFIGSDVCCFDGVTETCYAMEDGEFALAKRGEILFFGKDGKRIGNSPFAFGKIGAADGKRGRAHFMIKEIEEIPETLSVLAANYSVGFLEERMGAVNLLKIGRVKLVGCGTAYHAAVYGAELIRKNAGIEASAYVASEFRYGDPIVGPDTLFVAVSQSGETADTLAALELARKKGAVTVAVTNVVYSAVARLSDVVLPVFAGMEVAVASTKAYVAQLAVLYVLAKYLGRKDFSDIGRLAEGARKAIGTDISAAVEAVGKKNELFLLGRDLDYVTAAEAALKIKEVAYVNATAYRAGELKHGFLALVEKGSLAVVFATRKDLFVKTLSAASEAKARGAELLLFSCFGGEDFALTVNTENLGEELSPIVSVIPWQRLSYEIAVRKGFDPDKPRNLAKSVTVE
ncbi:MAG: glutamine--fructose-6-phosphate transaminase (isomerizing) [Candidatus Borkfalkiaceae bacterium]|nr:glutamine--fructose-6-phosphate transaminase (isomerizing) [Christensenellaceae bacterium]